jgi:hypothetical protein
MTSQSPRIYIYKITFEEVLYYYYGVHKEKKYNEYYIGSPQTHKWCWNFYTPKKQILQFFEFSDDGYLEAQEIEKRIIKPFYNTDKWCLNENCGGMISLDVLRSIGRKAKENKTGIFALSKEELRELGMNCKKTGTGMFSLTKHQRIENGIKNGIKSRENMTGIFSLTKEQNIQYGILGAKKCKELGVGIFALTREQLSECGKMAGETHKKNGTGVCGFSKEQRQENVKKTNSQIWECTVTGYRSTSGPLTNYQNKRGIDVSNRIRVQ